MSDGPRLREPPDFPKRPVSRDELVTWLRAQPDQAEFLRACYQDQPEIEAAERFRSSEEWQAALGLLPPPPGRALDLGGGNGIASYALACSGWSVVAAEPSRSAVTGGAAIAALLRGAGQPPTVVAAEGERLPLAAASFDLVYSRQVLHHVTDPVALCREVRRVLLPGGTYLACAEHVISSERQRQRFLDQHPMNRYTGDEDALPVAAYRAAFEGGGLELVRVLRPFDSSINIAPYTSEELRAELGRKLARLPGGVLAGRAALSPRGFPWLLRLLSWGYLRPGRPYTFVTRRRLTDTGG